MPDFVRVLHVGLAYGREWGLIDGVDRVVNVTRYTLDNTCSPVGVAWRGLHQSKSMCVPCTDGSTAGQRNFAVNSMPRGKVRG